MATATVSSPMAPARTCSGEIKNPVPIWDWPFVVTTTCPMALWGAEIILVLSTQSRLKFEEDHTPMGQGRRRVVYLMNFSQSGGYRGVLFCDSADKT